MVLRRSSELDDIMPRRTGQVEHQVTVAVSPEMHRLREEQMGLNFFLWTSELSYGFIHTSGDIRLAHAEVPAISAFNDIRSEAWFPNTAGRLKYGGTVGQFLDQLKKNVAVVAQATAVLWYSKFEKYLCGRIGPLAGHPRHWGPFTKTLCIPALSGASYPIQMATLLRADFCRDARNAMVHGDPPTSVEHPRVNDWKKRTKESLKKFDWRCAQPDREISEAAEYVVGQLTNQLKDAQAEGKELTPSFFYALFSFTNYDSLAFEIEEALMPGPSDGATIRREEGKIRRKDIIVPETTPMTQSTRGLGIRSTQK